VPPAAQRHSSAPDAERHEPFTQRRVFGQHRADDQRIVIGFRAEAVDQEAVERRAEHSAERRVKRALARAGRQRCARHREGHRQQREGRHGPAPPPGDDGGSADKRQHPDGEYERPWGHGRRDRAGDQRARRNEAD
jgi:hypothetical protein